MNSIFYIGFQFSRVLRRQYQPMKCKLTIGSKKKNNKLSVSTSISLFHQSGKNEHERKTMNQHYILVFYS